MINEKAYELGNKRSVIREIFEYAKRRSDEIGAENVYDFSIGNPSVPPPDELHETIERMIKDTPSVVLHGYTSAQGDKLARDTIAENLRKRFQVEIDGDYLYMTCGAAASLTISLKAIVNAGDEIIVIAPYFTEYKVFVEGAGAKLIVCPSDEKTLLPDLSALKKLITENTKGLIVNSPNNPSGVVYRQDTMESIATILKDAKMRFGNTVYLISDEPYRELIYDERVKVPFPISVYDDTIVCYSYSKSLSIPGERIGYIAVSPKATDAKKLYSAVCGAGRMLGYVCAPSLFQRAVAKLDGKTSDLSVYKKNRDLLYHGLTDCGFTCVYPDGAFYLFMKTPESDAYRFCERAKKYELLLVPADDFGSKGFVRIAYCVDTQKIEKAMPAFRALAQEYGL